MNELEDVDVIDPLVNVMVAPVKAAVYPAVRLVKVAVPDTAYTVAVPPSVQPPPPPVPTAAFTVVVLVVVLPYWSSMSSIGCCPRVLPFTEGAVGYCEITNWVPAPGLMV